MHERKLSKRIGTSVSQHATEGDAVCATACLTGVATAFAAPIGGLLFTIEEGASFYSTSIFWRGFLSTGIGVFTLHFLVECAVRSPSHHSIGP